MGKLLLLLITVSWFLGDGVEAGDDDKGGIPASIFNGDSAASVMDGLVAFAANYGNAAADYIASDSDAGATGSVENIGRFNLRLINCISVQGGMTRYFPLTISPNTTHSSISGYAKIKRHKLAITRGKTKLEQSCTYAVFDIVENADRSEFTDKERETKTVTKWVKLGFEVLKNVLHSNNLNVAFAVDEGAITPTWKPVGKVGKVGKVWENRNYDPFVEPKDPKKDAKKMVKQREAGSKETSLRRESIPHRLCHAEGDMCVEASIGTGPNPRFRFLILPKKVKDLTRKACVQRYRGEVNWDPTAKYTADDVVANPKLKVGDLIPVGECIRSKYCEYMDEYFDLDVQICKGNK